MELTQLLNETMRKYGYFKWTRTSDKEIHELFKGKESANFFFNGISIGQKKIDYKNRRISIGWKHTRALSNSCISLKLEKKGSKYMVTSEP